MQREATAAKFQRTKFFMSLSREEIEEDFLDLTRRRPARKPKKRPKYIQKQLDTIFQGLWLLEITQDMYKVNENPEGSSSVMNNGHGERLTGYDSEHDEVKSHLRSGGAFHPFKKKKTAPLSPIPAPPQHASPAAEEEEEGQQRKSRRCWSPKLHRRFLNALQQLGGDHVATPKQIKELMKVDELTNDEDKSHLQATHKKTSTSNIQQYKQPRSVHPCHQATATVVQTGTEMTCN